MKQARVKQWMSRKPITVTPDTTLWDASRLMTESRIRRLLVVEDGDLVGILTHGDLRSVTPPEAVALELRDLNVELAQLTVAHVMTADPVTISAEAMIDEAAWVMLEGKMSGLPVIDNDWELVGIITESDIFRLVVREWGKQANRYTEMAKEKKGVLHA